MAYFVRRCITNICEFSMFWCLIVCVSVYCTGAHRSQVETNKMGDLIFHPMKRRHVTKSHCLSSLWSWDWSPGLEWMCPEPFMKWCTSLYLDKHHRVMSVTRSVARPNFICVKSLLIGGISMGWQLAVFLFRDSTSGRQWWMVFVRIQLGPQW